MELIIDFIDALIPLGIGLFILVRPQVFGKKDLNTEENEKMVKRFKIIGVLLLIAGVLILISNLMTG
jgi:hypothetical protein